MLVWKVNVAETFIFEEEAVVAIAQLFVSRKGWPPKKHSNARITIHAKILTRLTMAKMEESAAFCIWRAIFKDPGVPRLVIFVIRSNTGFFFQPRAEFPLKHQNLAQGSANSAEKPPACSMKP